MGLTAQLDPDPTPHVRQPREQGLPTTLLVLLLVSMLCTGFSVAAFFVPGAVVSALCVVFCYALIVGVKLRDRRAWAIARSGHDHLDNQPRQVADENIEAVIIFVLEYPLGSGPRALTSKTPDRESPGAMANPANACCFSRMATR